MLSDSLQLISGKFIRRIINSLTTNRFVAVLVGLFVTTLVQSSSITTVTVIGFVNAGLMSLSQAIGVILGANIGTTITGWIIAIKVGKYSLLFIGLGIFPMLLFKNDKITSVAKVVFSLGLIFLGLGTMSGAFKPLRGHPIMTEMLTYFSAEDYLSLMATIGVGCVLTFVVQSSSAMLGITIALAVSGTISFQTSLALVLGENVGTTITALLAGVTANDSARRAAIAHAIFNICGVFIISLIFWKYMDFIEYIIAGDADFLTDDNMKPHIAAHIAAGHTVFNVTNVLIFLPFIHVIERITYFLIPKKDTKQVGHLKFLGTQTSMSVPLSITLARKEIEALGRLVSTTLVWTKDYLSDRDKNKQLKKKIQDYESITDNIHQEMMRFLGQVMTVSLTIEQSEEIKSILKMSDELESLADYCLKIVFHLSRIEESQFTLDSQTKDEILNMLAKCTACYEYVMQEIAKGEDIDFDRVINERKEILRLANAIRDSYRGRMISEKLEPIVSLTVSDIVLDISRIFSHSRNLAEAFMGVNSCKG